MEGVSRDTGRCGDPRSLHQEGQEGRRANQRGSGSLSSEAVGGAQPPVAGETGQGVGVGGDK